MDSEIPYRIALIGIIIATMGVVLQQRKRAAGASDSVAQQVRRPGWTVGLRIAGNLLWLATLVYLAYPDGVRWASLPLTEGVRWSGLGLAALCPPLLFWILQSLGANNFTPTEYVSPDATLCTRGPYRWVRHPYYVVAGLLMIGVTLLSANGLIGLLSLLVLGLLVVRTPREERELLQRFGTAYRDYCNQTGRFLPRLRQQNPE